MTIQTMVDEQDQQRQQELLMTYRRTLAQLCKQAAQYGGESFAPPQVANGIHEARDNIWRIKNALRSSGINIDDDPNDAPMSIRSPTAIEAAHQLLATLPLDTIPTLTPLPLGSRMPFNHNPLFVGRAEDLRLLAVTLKSGSTAAIGQIAAATGLGGIGKTQLACEFVHRYGSYFAGGVFWLNFGDPELVPAEIRVCGGVGHMELRSDFDRLTPDDQLRLVRAAWQSSLPRLLVFDNCEDEALLATWRPLNSGCHILITSRRLHWDVSLDVQVFPLGVLSRRESEALLHKHRPDLPIDSLELNEIATELGYLPLALHLAGSFLSRYRYMTTPAEYLAELRSTNALQHPSLEGHNLREDTSPTRHLQHVGRTFALSYNQLDPNDRVDMLARSLLTHAAHFEPGAPVQRTLLLSLLDVLGDSRTVLEAEDALTRLIDLGLLEVTGEGSLRLHRLLAAFIRQMTEQEDVQTPLLRKFAVENERWLKGQPYDGRFAYELFRRALAEQNIQVWGYVCSYYKPMIVNWINSSNSSFRIKNSDAIVDGTFDDFRKTITSNSFDNFPTLDELLNCLEQCYKDALDKNVDKEFVTTDLLREADAIRPEILSDIELTEVVLKARREKNYYRLQPENMQYTHELFRRAIVLRDEDAWSAIYEMYSSVVADWISTRTISINDVELIIADVFARFWSAITPERFASFPSMSILLVYMRQVAKSVFVDFLKDARTAEIPIFAYTESHVLEQVLQVESNVDVESEAIQAITQKELLTYVGSLFRDKKERLVVLLSLSNEYKPADIYSKYSHLFESIDEVYSIKYNALRRLRNDPEILDMLSPT